MTEGVICRLQVAGENFKYVRTVNAKLIFSKKKNKKQKNNNNSVTSLYSVTQTGSSLRKLFFAGAHGL